MSEPAFQLEPFDSEGLDGVANDHNCEVWPYPYEMRSTGLWLQKDDKPEFLCRPFEVIGQSRTNSGDGWGLMIEFYDGDGRQKTLNISRADLISERGEAMAALASQGLKFPPGATKKLKAALASLDPEARVRIVETTGWVEPGKAYMLGDRPIGAEQSEPVRLMGDAQPMRLAGTFEQWRALVALPSTGNTRLVLAISAAFVGPLLALTGSEGLGLHFRGASSSGKSTALAVAASVAGVRVGTWRATSNGLEGIATASNDGLLILDELGEVSAREVGGVVYMLGNGQGKQRAGQAGEARKRKNWRVAVLSSGEVSIAQKAQEDGYKGKTRAGQEVRLIDIEADAGAGCGVFENVPDALTPSQFSDHLKDVATKNSGHAMPRYIEALQADMGKPVLLLFTQLKSAFASAYSDVGGQAARVRDKFALLACAGEFATHCGLSGWNNGEATRSAKACFEAWFNQRKGASHEASLAIETVRGFIQSHGASRFHVAGDDEANSRVINRAGWVREVKGEKCYCFASVPWKQEVLAGQDIKLACSHLTQKGLLITDAPEANGRKRFTYKLSTPDGLQNVYAVRASILLDGEG
jgi:putative DNA primase/helicase